MWERAVWDVHGLCVAVCEARGCVSFVNERRVVVCLHIYSVCECEVWGVRFVGMGLCK